MYKDRIGSVRIGLTSAGAFSYSDENTDGGGLDVWISKGYPTPPALKWMVVVFVVDVCGSELFYRLKSFKKPTHGSAVKIKSPRSVSYPEVMYALIKIKSKK